MSVVESVDGNPAPPAINRFESILQTRWGWRLAILLVLGLALFARTQNLHRQLWIDELITWDVIKLPFDQMIRNRLEEGHLPLFFILERYWTQATGDALWSMRLPSITADMIGVFLLILLGLEGYSRSVALLAAALMAVHFQAVWAAQIMRPYAIVSALAIGASIVFMRLEREGKWRYVIALAALTAVGIITHATFLFFVCCQVMYLVWNNWPLQRHASEQPSTLMREIGSVLAQWARHPWTRLIAWAGDVRIGSAQLLRRQWKPFAAYTLAGLMMSYVWLGWNQKQHQVNPESDKGAVSVERMYRYLMDMAFGQYGKSDVVEDIGLKTRQFISWKKLGKLGQNIDKKLEKQPDDWFRILAAPALLIALGVTAWTIFKRRSAIACLAKEESGYTARPELSADAASALWGPPGGDAKGRAVALTRYVICCVLGFMLTMFVFSNVIQNKAGHPRYYSSITGELCLGYVAIAFLIRKGWLRWCYAGLLLVCVLLVTSGWLITRGDGMRDSLQYIEAHRKSGEPVIGTFKISTQAAYHYYAPEAYKTVFSSFDRESTDTVQLKTMLLEKMQATPDGTVWLLLHHWRNSPIFQRKPTDVVQEPCFKILEQKDIRGTAILHLQRAISKAP